MEELTRETKYTTIAITMNTKTKLDELRMKMVNDLDKDINLFDGKLSYNQVIGALITAWNSHFKI